MSKQSILWRPFHSWLVMRGVTQRPWLIRWIPRWYRTWYFDSVICPRLMAAQASGAGIFVAWIEPGTSRIEVAQWLEECIVTAKATHDDYGMIRVVIAHCTEAAWEAGGADLTQQIVLDWNGMANQWWSVGYPLALRATAVEHSGLYIGLNITGMWISCGMAAQMTHIT
jgi:hypothetical protein